MMPDTVTIVREDAPDLKYEYGDPEIIQDGIKFETMYHPQGGDCVLITDTRAPYHDKHPGDVFYFEEVDAPWALNGDIPRISEVPGSERFSNKIPQSADRHYLLGGECIVLFKTPLAQPNPEKRWGLIQTLSKKYNLQALAHPRMMHILSYFGDRKEYDTPVQGRRDQGWLNDHWHRRTRGVPRVGWYKHANPMWGSGYMNGVYHSVFLGGLKYLISGEESDWYFNATAAFKHATLGWCHASSDDPDTIGDRMLYTKGSDFMGSSYGSKWEKTWSSGVALWYYISGGHPIFARVLGKWYDRMRDDDRLMKDSQVWAKNYGSRRLARALEELHAAYTVRRDSKYVDRAMHLLDWLKTCDLTKPLPHSKHPSPWQDYQVARACRRWAQIPGAVDMAVQIETVVNEKARVDDETWGVPCVAYRYNEDGPLVRNDDWGIHLAFLCGTGDPNVIGGKVREQGIIVPQLDDMGADYAPQGGSWIRTCAYILAGKLGL